MSASPVHPRANPFPVTLRPPEWRQEVATMHHFRPELASEAITVIRPARVELSPQAHLSQYESRRGDLCKDEWFSFKLWLPPGSLCRSDAGLGGSALTSFTNASPSVFYFLSAVCFEISKLQKLCSDDGCSNGWKRGLPSEPPSADVVTVSADFTVGWYSDSLCTVGTSTQLVFQLANRRDWST
jgi:hypothetical protein